MNTPPALLELRNIEVTYHRTITAVQGVSLAVREGSITALIGTNGAGKTTTLAAIAGFTRADDAQITEGEIVFGGARINGWRSDRVSALGISLVPEREKIFATLTIEENLAACPANRLTGDRMAADAVYALFPQLAERRTAIAGYLSGGERQMLALSMALISRPRLLMVDEMNLGLAPIIVRLLRDTARKLRDEMKLTLLIVEQNAHTAMELADYAYVMESGRVVFDGARDRLMAHPDFREFYLGLGEGSEQKHYQDVKQYRRKRRWFG